MSNEKTITPEKTMRSAVRQRFPWGIARRRFGIMMPYRLPSLKSRSKKMKAQFRKIHGHPATFRDFDALLAIEARRNGEYARALYLEIRSWLRSIAIINHKKPRTTYRERPWFLTRMHEDKVFCRKCGEQISRHIQGKCPPDPFDEQEIVIS